MGDQYSQGTHTEYDVVRSTQFVEDLSRSVPDSRTQHLQLAPTNAWPPGSMENAPVSNYDLSSFMLNNIILRGLRRSGAVISKRKQVCKCSLYSALTSFLHLYTQVFRGASAPPQRLDQSQVRPLPFSLDSLANVYSPISSLSIPSACSS